MSDRKDGGPYAFPHEKLHGETRDFQTAGMTLRDWFAGQALAGLLSGEAGSYKEQGAVAGLITDGHSMLACHAYLLADALLAERDRHE